MMERPGKDRFRTPIIVGVHARQPFVYQGTLSDARHAGDLNDIGRALIPGFIQGGEFGFPAL